MPELFEFQEIVESHPIALAIACAAAALLAAIVTRWMDQRTLDRAHELLTAYEDEVRRLNEERADMLTRLEERNDELRRARAELARLATAAARTDVPRQEIPRRPDLSFPEGGGPEVALPRAGQRDPRDSHWR